MKHAHEVVVNGRRIFRLENPPATADRWNRWVVVENYPYEDGRSSYTRTEVGRSRWRRRAVAIGHRWRRNLQHPEAYMTVEPIE